jgi:hypothetical protein
MYGKGISLTHLQHIAILVPAVAKSCKPTRKKKLANIEKKKKIKHESTTKYIVHGFLSSATTPYADLCASL